MEFIIDASVALGWCFSDEATPTTRRLLKQLDKETAHVPVLWFLEVGNVLLTAIRKKRLTQADATKFLSLINSLKIEVDLDAATNGAHDIFLLAQAENLTTYDAAYLSLAMRLGLPLATRDKALIVSAKRVGVDLIPS